MIDKKFEPATEIGQYWDGIGGDRWVSNINRLDEMLAPTTSILMNEISKHSSKNTLELGCGAGDLAIAASSHGHVANIDAVDISYNILDLAKKRNQNNSRINFIHCDAETYSFKNNFYDLIYSRFGVMFFNDPNKAFINIRKCIKNQGIFIFLSWDKLENNPWMDVPSKAAFSVLPQPPKPLGNPPGAFSLANKKIIRDILDISGFKEINSTNHKIKMNLGGLEHAVNFATQLGPAATPFTEAKIAKKAAAKRAIKSELAKFEQNQNIRLPGSCWLTIAQ